MALAQAGQAFPYSGFVLSNPSAQIPDDFRISSLVTTLEISVR